MEYEIVCDSLGTDISVYRATDFKITPEGCILYNENTDSVVVVENITGLIVLPYQG